MSMAQTTRDFSPSSDPHCPHCNTPLPTQATFCAACGERVVAKPVSLLLQDADITSRYRITSLIRRRPYVSLLFALDTQQSRPVAIRDIDITSLDEKSRLRACEIVQQEYDLLRRKHIPSVMPAIDLRYTQGHLYIIAGWPLTNQEKPVHLSTLQDVLQSGIGLPDTSISLAWGEQLSLSLEQLHSQHIILGDLDLQTLILGNDQYNGSIEIMISWLPHALYDLFPSTSTPFNTSSNYTAPEVLLGKPEPRSDIYSLGAILYILLTGVPPDEATARLHRRLRSPSEINPRLNSTIDELIMKAIAIESTERFSNASALAEAIARQLARKRPSPAATLLSSSPLVPIPTQLETDIPRVKERTIDEIINTDTVAFTPLPQSHLAEWQSPVHADIPDAPNTLLTTPRIVESSPVIIESPIQQPSSNGTKNFTRAEEVDYDELPLSHFNNPDAAPNLPSKATRSLRQRITGILPAISRPQSSAVQQSAPIQPLPEVSQKAPSLEVALRPPTTIRTPSVPLADAHKPSFIKHLQRVIMGEQKHVTAAAAIIETPLRVQPLQTYAIRIQLLGRGSPYSMNTNDMSAAGLSALTEGAVVRIEVRSALYQSYAYIVQQAAVAIPAEGFAAEVTIPMKPLSNGPSGRRDRLHIFFMDEHRRSLYEKPFVIELFISHLVQPGREGHNVLTIPL